MTDSPQQWLAAILLAAFVVGGALRSQALVPSGAVAAFVLGIVVVALGGWWPGVILVAFFASSSVISKLNPSSALKQQRGSRRDWVQVLANGLGHSRRQRTVWSHGMAAVVTGRYRRHRRRYSRYMEL